MARIRHGIIYLKMNGEMYQATGDFTYNVGNPKRSPLFGSGGRIAGTKEEPQEPYIKGNITIQSDTDIEAFTGAKDATITLEMDNMTMVLTNAEYYADGEANTSEGQLQAEFFGDELKQI